MAVDAELLLPDNVGSGADPLPEDGEVESVKRLRLIATSDEAPSVQQVLAAQNMFSVQDLGSLIRSFQQRQKEMSDELAERRQLDMVDALGLSSRQS